ncbi:MAG TPA: glycosyltransferase family 9 protein [Coleofasciculaceae cyanobacterium]|jgi:ADP-heptose:LPS heptosyltransferase
MKRLLVIRQGALGDLIHVSPSLTAIQVARPEVEIHFLSSPAYASLLELFPAIDRVWAWDKRLGWPGLFRLASELRQAGIDGVVNLHPSFKTWVLTQLIQPAGQALYHKEKLRVKGQAQRAIPRRHAVADFYEPFRRLLSLPSLADPVPRLALPEAASGENSSEKPVQKSVTERWVGVIPGVGGKRGNRAWLPESYQQLIQALLTDKQVKILLIGGPDERALAEQLCQAVPDIDRRLVNHCGRHDLTGTMHLLAACDLVIGGDTGPMHLAAALGRPLIGLYGPTSAARTGPLGASPSNLLTPPESLACWPCEQPTCPLTGDDHLRCMRDIPVADVLTTCRALLAAH